MADQINDRGAKKWTRLTIPEFRESLGNIYQYKDEPKSTEQIAKLESLLMVVNGSKTRVGINYNLDGTTYEICGYIIKWHQQQRIIDLIDDYGEQKILEFCYIESIEILS